MILTVDQLRELPVGEAKLRAKRVLVDYKKIKIAALTLARSGLFGRTQTIPFSTVTAITAEQVQLGQPSPVARDAQQEPFADLNRFGDLTEREVFTERKRYLGKLVTYKFDSETGNLTALWVKPPLVLRDLWRQILLISRSQIVGITPQAIIVDEAIIKAALKPAAAAELAREPETALGAASGISAQAE
ncbi:MAG: hypothetical protein U0517_01755 [Candidatus Andersenbacteria bacterium]